MRLVKKSVPMMVALLFSGVVVAAGSSGVPTSIEHPVPMQPVPPVLRESLAPIAPAQAAVSTAKPSVAKPAPVYADTPPATTGATQALPADVNTNVPYASVLPKGAEIVPGAPGKNEFFIVAAEDAAKIRQLVDHTKPGREIAAADINSKQPIVKVKLDESNATLVSMDVVTSVNAVAKAAIKPSVQLTANDEVMSIYTKNRITPVGSRVVAIAAPKTPIKRNEVDDKPMLKLLAMADAASTPAVPAASPVRVVANPLEATKPVKPVKGVIPDVVAVKETIEAPQAAPLALPPASKEAAPTLEMVLQQANHGSNKLKSKSAGVLAEAVDAAGVKVNKQVIEKSKTKVATKGVSVKAVALSKQRSTVTTHVAVKKSVDKNVLAQSLSKKALKAGKVVAYEQMKAGDKKESWGARHGSSDAKTKKLAGKQAANKKMAAKKRPLNVGVVHSYADYLTQTGHRARHSTE